jgi:hypothetical protein
MKTDKSEDKSGEPTYYLGSQKLFHDTKANLKQGELIEPGVTSNNGKRKNAAYVYISATLNAAVWGQACLGRKSRPNSYSRADRPAGRGPKFAGQEILRQSD